MTARPRLVGPSAARAALAAGALVAIAAAAGFAPLPAPPASPPAVPRALSVNIIDGPDDRDSLLAVGPSLGLSPAEIARIRAVSGYVGCLSPSPSMGTGTLFVTNRQVLTVAHILFERSGRPRSKCFFRAQSGDPVTIDLILEPRSTAFGAERPIAGSVDDYAIVRLAEPALGGEPLPVDASSGTAGDRLIEITAHPAGMAKEVDRGVPVAQGCTLKRVVPAGKAGVPQLKTNCDATGSSSGGLNLARVGGRLVLRGITVTTGPWQQPKFVGAPFSEKTGSVTTALGTAGAILAAGRRLAAR